jgi:hypothetical protein
MASGKNYYRSVIEPFFPHSHGKMTIYNVVGFPPVKNGYIVGSPPPHGRMAI